MNSSSTEEFDAMHGFYGVQVGDYIKYQYEILRQVGKGSFGAVFAAFDHKANVEVAIKLFRSDTQGYEDFIEEVRVYEYLNLCYPNGTNGLCRMFDNFKFRGHPCIVMELHDRDVCTDVIEARSLGGYDIKKVKTVITSILKALKLLHDVNIIHGDLKLNNICFCKSNSTDVKIFDFGSSKFGDQPFSDHSQGRHYRSPEMVLCLPFGTPIDMWALACVTFELFTGRVLFKGTSTQDQLNCVMEVLGTPPPHMVCASPVANKYFYNNAEFPIYCYVERSDGLVQLPKGKPSLKGVRRELPGTKDTLSIFNNDPAMLDFIVRCLEWDPEKRMTVYDALHHRWILDQDVVPINASNEQPSATAGTSNSSNISPHLPTFPDKLFTGVPTYCSNKKMVRSISNTEISKESLDLDHKWALARSNYLKDPNIGREQEEPQQGTSSM